MPSIEGPKAKYVGTPRNSGGLLIPWHRDVEAQSETRIQGDIVIARTIGVLEASSLMEGRLVPTKPSKLWARGA